MATGAAIGSIVPGIGTFIGGAIGLAAGALMDDHVKKVSDEVEGAIFDKDTTEYEFICPKCGRTWTTSKFDEELQAIIDESEDCDDEEYEEGEETDEAEIKVFVKYFDWCCENTEAATEDFEKTESFIIDTINKDVSSPKIKSCYYFLLSWLNLVDLIDGGFFADSEGNIVIDYKGIRKGLDYIN
mgnify:FL=1